MGSAAEDHGIIITTVNLMARFLFTVWSFRGHINPSMAIAQVLRERGHEVAFSTGGAAQTTITEQGFACFPFKHLNEARVYEIVFSPQSTSLW